MITSFWYLFFLFVGVLVYYIAPKKLRWMILLALSVGFYFYAAKPYTIFFLMMSTVLAYGATRYMELHSKKDGAEAKIAKAAIFAVICNVVIWFLLKGSRYWVDISEIVHLHFDGVPVLSPLPVAEAMGMGYYTAQVIGYIVDVWWGNCKPQRNICKLFLFVCFFPQLTVGPISRYGDLEHIYEGHAFSYERIAFGAQRILWGFFKKLVIADRLGIFIDAIWANTGTYNGLWLWMAVFLYPVQIYSDFSGCMDIVLGSAELFGITLAENFKNPFYSRTTQEFWQRWHMTLGSWARDYVYYPLLKSKWLIKMGRKYKKKYGKRLGKLIPWTVAMAILWFVMGFWHGSVQHIFGVSLWFFTIAFLGELLAPLFEKMIFLLGIDTDRFSWHLFQQVRTYVLYSLGVVFFSAANLTGAIGHYKELLHSFSVPNFWILFDGRYLQPGDMTWTDVNLVIVGIACLLAVAHLREKYGYARTWISKQGFVFRWLLWIGLLFLVAIYGLYGPGFDASAFIYQNF